MANRTRRRSGGAPTRRLSSAHSFKNNRIIREQSISAAWWRVDMYGNNNIAVNLENGYYHIPTLKFQTIHVNSDITRINHCIDKLM